jgi:hypothetical protein
MVDSKSSPDTPEAAWRTALILMVSLPIGVTLLAAVGLWLSTTQPRNAAMDTAPLTLAWVVLTLATSIAAFIAWLRMVRPLLPSSGFRADSPSDGELGRLQTGLIVCMALVEGAALFGGVLLILGAGPVPALVGVILIWTAFLALRPRRGWYGLR